MFVVGVATGGVVEQEMFGAIFLGIIMVLMLRSLFALGPGPDLRASGRSVRRDRMDWSLNVGVRGMKFKRRSFILGIPKDAVRIHFSVHSPHQPMK